LRPQTIPGDSLCGKHSPATALTFGVDHRAGTFGASFPKQVLVAVEALQLPLLTSARPWRV